MTVSVALPEVVTEDGDIEHVDSAIAAGTVQVKFTAPVNPLVGVKVRVEVPDCPGLEILMVPGLAARVNPGGADVTVTETGADVELA